MVPVIFDLSNKIAVKNLNISMMYGMNIRGDRELEFSRNRIRFAQDHGDIQVFHCNFADFADLRISTGQRFRKERSVQDIYMG